LKVPRFTQIPLGNRARDRLSLSPKPQRLCQTFRRAAFLALSNGGTNARGM
jgi:hypothetical protein